MGNPEFEKDRTKSNPLFNNRKLKLGTFCSNLEPFPTKIDHSDSVKFSLG